jgi:hypothetical protein
MSGEASGYAARVRHLREAFDGGFTDTPSPERARGEVLLRITAGGEPAAVPLRDIASVSAGAATTPVVAAVRGFAGFTVAAGRVTPVYDLAVVLDRSGAAAAARRTLLFAAGHELAFAVDAIDGYIVAEDAGMGPAATVVMTGGTAVRLVALAPLIGRIQAETRAVARRSRR